MEERIQEVPPDLQRQLDELRVRVEAIERALGSMRPAAVGKYEWGDHRFTEDELRHAKRIF